MSFAAALPLIEKICSALSYAHAQESSIRTSSRARFHHDVGEPKLLDFGIASPMRSASDAKPVHPRSLGALSPNYASIEQFWDGRRSRDDVYSVAFLATNC